jgi:RNA polymerase sigma-B factor
LIKENLPLVKALARRYVGRTEEYEDLVQVGTIGLIKAIDRFDPTREVPLQS